MTIDQTTGRRTRKTGLTAHDPAKAYPGYTLYTPMFGDGVVYLLDMDGNEVHRWEMPHPPGDYGYLLPNGNLFYLGKTPENPGEMYLAWPLFKGGALMEVDWDGNVVWEHRDPAHHHDGRRTVRGDQRPHLRGDGGARAGLGVHHPHFFRAPVFGDSNAVFRAFRYGLELFPKLG